MVFAVDGYHRDNKKRNPNAIAALLVLGRIQRAIAYQFNAAAYLNEITLSDPDERKWSS